MNENEPQVQYYYVDRRTRGIYQVQFYPSFVLCRPILPGMETSYYKVDNLSFMRHYEECQASAAGITEALAYGNDYPIVARRR